MTGFTSTSAVYPTNEKEVLCAVVRQIRDTVSGLDDPSTCFVSDVPWPSPEIHGDVLCLVSPAGGQFDGETHIGAGEMNIVESAMIQVSLWSRIRLDPLERSDSQFFDRNRGLLHLKHLLLKSLAGRQLFSAPSPSGTVRPLLTEHLRPVKALHPPGKQHEDDYSTCALQFEATFQWDLS